VSRGKLIAIAAALAGTLALPSPAAAGPAEDYQAVRADWQRDGSITPCRFSEEELANARAIADANPDDQYTGFPDAIDRELARRRSGGCEGRTPDSVRDRSALAGLRIVRVVARGGVRRERVRVRNTSRRTVSLNGATLRNRRGSRAVLPRGVRLTPGNSITIRIRCRRGRRVASGQSVYACRRSALLADGGDVARLVDRRGVVVSQRGFGRYRSTVSF
jgi:hypothetical protein